MCPILYQHDLADELLVALLVHASATLSGAAGC